MMYEGVNGANRLNLIGWEAGIRTPIGGSRVRSLTVRRPPSIERAGPGKVPRALFGLIVSKAGRVVKVSRSPLIRR